MTGAIYQVGYEETFTFNSTTANEFENPFWTFVPSK
jgi:hypothetical protein